VCLWVMVVGNEEWEEEREHVKGEVQIDRKPSSNQKQKQKRERERDREG
jgi:hypothetical protein